MNVTASSYFQIGTGKEQMSPFALNMYLYLAEGVLLLHFILPSLNSEIEMKILL